MDTRWRGRQRTNIHCNDDFTCLLNIVYLFILTLPIISFDYFDRDLFAHLIMDAVSSLVIAKIYFLLSLEEGRPSSTLRCNFCHVGMDLWLNPFLCCDAPSFQVHEQCINYQRRACTWTLNTFLSLPSSCLKSVLCLHMSSIFKSIKSCFTIFFSLLILSLSLNECVFQRY